MGLNFYDNHDFQKNQGGGYKIMRHTVRTVGAEFKPQGLLIVLGV
jgi:hypothetical protein